MVKMKVNNEKSSYCDECGRGWNDTAEMYTIRIFAENHDICKSCCDELFRKTLRASCMYDGKVKNKEARKRAENEARR